MVGYLELLNRLSDERAVYSDDKLCQYEGIMQLHMEWTIQLLTQKQQQHTQQAPPC